MNADGSIPLSAPRYLRHAKLSWIGAEGQNKLLSSTALVIGCGSLGCAQAMFLARAGVGRLLLADRDVVRDVNLPTQLVLDEADLKAAAPKAEAAARHLRGVNSEIALEPLVGEISASNIEPLVSRADVVLDATDNFETRFLLNEAAVKHGKPWFYGGVLGTDGMAMAVKPGAGACLRCLGPLPPPDRRLPQPDVFGVLNAAAVWVASLQAAQALRCLAAGEADWGVMHTLDLLRGTATAAAAPRDPACPCCSRREFAFLSKEQK